MRPSSPKKLKQTTGTLSQAECEYVLTAHLTPLLEDAVAEALDVLELADVSGHDQDIRLADKLRARRAGLSEPLGVHVCERDAQAFSVERDQRASVSQFRR